MAPGGSPPGAARPQLSPSPKDRMKGDGGYQEGAFKRKMLVLEQDRRIAKMR